jgi:hypothetical protein
MGAAMRAENAVTAEAREVFEAASRDLGVASERVHRVALEVSEEHWVAVRRASRAAGGLFIQYAVRVRRRQYGVTIEWMKGMPARKGSEKRVIYRSITRGEGTRYRRSMFIGALPWEKPIIMEAEAGFGAVREVSARLSQAGRRLGWIGKVLERGGDVEPKRLAEVVQQVESACKAVRGLGGYAD